MVITPRNGISKDMGFNFETVVFAIPTKNQYLVETFDFLLTTSHCVTWLHKLVPHLYLQTPKHYVFSLGGIREMFEYNLYLYLYIYIITNSRNI